MNTQTKLDVTPTADHTTNLQDILYGFCHCGCGQKTNISEKTNTGQGYVKGRPRNFIVGHNNILPRNPSRLVLIGNTWRRTIPLTREMEAIVDLEDYERVAQYPWCAVRGCKTWYAERAPARGLSVIKMHHLTLPPPNGMITDHADGNGLHNWRLNLRAATYDQNAHNRQLRCDSLTGYKGVTYLKKRDRWVARICVGGISRYIITCDNPVDAACAYDRQALKHFGKFARLNFPQEDYLAADGGGAPDTGAGAATGAGGAGTTVPQS